MDKLQNILMGLSDTELTCSNLTPKEKEQRRADDYNSAVGKLNKQDGYDCPICLNKGDIAYIGEGYNGTWVQFHRMCKCDAVRRSIRRMQKSGLKNIISDYTFDKYEASEPWQQTIKDAAVTYSKTPEGWFFIGGQSGAGKTHICTAICREFLLAGREVKYMLWRDDIVRIKNVVGDAEQYSGLIATYKNVEVLYIDDLFKTGKGHDGMKQRPTGADVNVAFEILNYRYNDPKLLTIISSECTMDDILDIDEATGGRIFEKAKTAFSLGQDKSKNYRLKGVVEL